MKQVRKPISQATPKQLAGSKMKATMLAVKEQNIVGIDEMKFANMRQSRFITLTLTNNDTTKTAMIVLGTPIGDTMDYNKVPLNVAPNANEDNYIDFAPAMLQDNLGNGANFLKLLNRRFLRHAIIVSRIEVITSDSAYGQKQRQQQTSLITVPYNSASDSQKTSGAFIPQFTEYTGSQIISSPKLLGDFTGVVYPLLMAEGTVASPIPNSIQMNIFIGAVDVPNFGNIK